MSHDFPPEDGACVGRPTDWWYPIIDRKDPAYEASKSDGRRALKICETCAVKEPCLQYALRHEAYGIWGGTKERERDRIRMQYNIPIPLGVPMRRDKRVRRPPVIA